MRNCTYCYENKDESEFSLNGRYLRARCKVCCTAIRVAQRHARGLKPPGRRAQEEPIEKICTGCKILKPSRDYYRHPQSKNGRLQARCKACIGEYNSKWVQKNPRKAREVNRIANRRSHVLRKYGVTRDEYKKMVEIAGGLCQACKNPERTINKEGTVWELCVDHDHITGKVRGLLCHDCNRSSGYANDDPARLRQIADYLEKRE